VAQTGRDFFDITFPLDIHITDYESKFFNLVSFYYLCFFTHKPLRYFIHASVIEKAYSTTVPMKLTVGGYRCYCDRTHPDLNTRP